MALRDRGISDVANTFDMARHQYPPARYESILQIAPYYRQKSCQKTEAFLSAIFIVAGHLGWFFGMYGMFCHFCAV